MQRLTSIHPSDLTAFPSGRGTITMPASNAGTKILMYNETPLNIDLDFLNGTSDVLHAWEANYWTLDGNVDEIDWNIDVDSLNVVNPPINAVFLTLYQPNETLRDKTYPMPLIRQIGGQQAIVSGSSTLVNDGSAAGTQIAESTPVDAASSTISILNDGTVTIKGDVAGVLTTLLQLIPGAAAGASSVMLSDNVRKTQILGLLQVDGTTFVNQIQAFGDLLMQTGTNIRMQQSGIGVNANSDVLAITQAASRYDTHLKAPGGAGTGSVILFETEGVQVSQADVNAALRCKNSKPIVFNFGSLVSIGFAAFSPPSGISTITHNFGFVPTIALWQGGQIANVNPGTTTAAVYNLLANSCTINNFAAVPGFLLYLKA